ncbi:MAG TPA: DUF2007 domain-containing protein [Edaphobacter sp.]
MSTSNKIPEPTPNPAPDLENMVSVGKYLEPLDAQMEKGLLESAGIECFLQGENANSLLGAAFRARLLVHKKDEQAAREVLATVDEDAEDELCEVDECEEEEPASDDDDE